jgi:hypothetical protein
MALSDFTSHHRTHAADFGADLGTKISRESTSPS